jgi:hypothetical protein
MACILFLNGLLPNSAPLLFGELFTTVLCDVLTGFLVRNYLFSFGTADGLFIPVKLGFSLMSHLGYSTLLRIQLIPREKLSQRSGTALGVH